ncbi:hypothetical protein C4587_00945 [Candidatus Parcubacteria bacterium]|nr:MAG: hypothetical protein C4587_00945 [Candidatus Parcubacteria bacterium]
MPSWAVLAAIVVAGAVVYLLRRRLFDMIASGGGAAERAKRAEADRATLQKQTEILLQDRTIEDTARDMENGQF